MEHRRFTQRDQAGMSKRVPELRPVAAEELDQVYGGSIFVPIPIPGLNNDLLAFLGSTPPPDGGQPPGGPGPGQTTFETQQEYEDRLHALATQIAAQMRGG
jgi:hypothetical protein